MTGNFPTTITAAVRVRPFLSRELHDHDNLPVVRIPKYGLIRLLNKNVPDISAKQFVFDHTFWSFNDDPKAPRFDGPDYADQTTVYETIGSPLLQRALEGYNACLFAYGMTGSGKTYSVTGTSDDPGIIPRLSEELFRQIAARQCSEVDYSVELSYFEIYNEKIRDLLSNADSGPLAVREHPVTGPYVEGLSHIGVRSSAEVLGWLRVGGQHRTVASTDYNEQSSRSHCVFTLYITRRTLAKYSFGDVIETVYSSRINIIDLAGSERQSSGHVLEDRLNESCQINKSLFTLGKVISQLTQNTVKTQSTDITPSTEPRQMKCPPIQGLETQTPGQLLSKRPGYVSYRDSVLTWLLRDSLGGNSMTTMLATISPCAIHYEETLATLRYAKKAQSIVNTAVINEDPQGCMIRQLISEVNRLRQASALRPERGSPQAFEVARLRELLVLREKEVCELSRQLAERTLRHGQPYTGASTSQCAIQDDLKPLITRSTSPLIVEPIDYSFGADDHATPMKRQPTVPLVNDAATSPSVALPVKCTVQDASTDPKDIWGCDRESWDRLSGEVERLRTELKASLDAHEATKHALELERSRSKTYYQQTSVFLQYLCDHMKHMIAVAK